MVLIRRRPLTLTSSEISRTQTRTTDYYHRIGGFPTLAACAADTDAVQVPASRSLELPSCFERMSNLRMEHALLLLGSLDHLAMVAVGYQYTASLLATEEEALVTGGVIHQLAFGARPGR